MTVLRRKLIVRFFNLNKTPRRKAYILEAVDDTCQFYINSEGDIFVVQYIHKIILNCLFNFLLQGKT